MKKSVIPIVIAFMACIFFSSCRDSVSLDLSKVDSTYFIGGYVCNLDKKVERIVLKPDGNYDYYWEPDSILIIDAGSWKYNKEKYPDIFLHNMPNYRKEISVENVTYNLHLDIDCNNDLGDLFFMIRGGATTYIFKPDNRKKGNQIN